MGGLTLMGRSMTWPSNRGKGTRLSPAGWVYCIDESCGKWASKRNKAKKKNPLLYFFHLMCVRSCFTPAHCLYTACGTFTQKGKRFSLKA